MVGECEACSDCVVVLAGSIAHYSDRQSIEKVVNVTLSPKKQVWKSLMSVWTQWSGRRQRLSQKKESSQLFYSQHNYRHGRRKTAIKSSLHRKNWDGYIGSVPGNDLSHDAREDFSSDSYYCYCRCYSNYCYCFGGRR